MRVELDRIGVSLGISLHAEGDLTLLEQPRRMLLLSRTEKQISPHVRWLIALRQATAQLLRNREVLVCGSGRVPYDLPLWLVRQSEGSAIVVLMSEAERTALYPALLPEKHLLIWPEIPFESLKQNEGFALRDRLVGALANRATTIQIRAQGNMAAIALELKARGVSIDEPPEKCATGGLSTSEISGQSIGDTGANSGTHVQNTTLGDWSYLTHFTRESDGLFPGESLPEYFQYLCSAAAPRDALSSLLRILQEGCIRASSRLMPQQAAMVCWTALAPDQTLELRRWRRGLRRWTFTPYGVAIRREALLQCGAQAVLYKTKDDAIFEKKRMQSSTQSCDRRLEQTYSEGEGDWSREREWRVAGDVRLVDFSPEDIAIVVATEADAAEISRRHRYRTIVLGTAQT